MYAEKLKLNVDKLPLKIIVEIKGKLKEYIIRATKDKSGIFLNKAEYSFTFYFLFRASQPKHALFFIAVSSQPAEHRVLLVNFLRVKGKNGYSKQTDKRRYNQTL